MKAIVQTANVEGDTIPLKEVSPFWFVVSGPLLGMLLGLLGAWLSAGRLPGKFIRIDKS
jgi:hypothetical protein